MLEGARVRKSGLRVIRAYAVAVFLSGSCQTVGSVRATGDASGSREAAGPTLEVPGRGPAGSTSVADALRQRPEFDPLALTLEEAHRRGLEVHAWVNVHLIVNAPRLPADRAHLVHARPDLLAVPRELAGDLHGMSPEESGYLERLRRHAEENRSRVEGLYSSPSSPEVKERVYAVIMDLVDRYDVDGIHLDYVRYPSGEYDYSRCALARFRSWVGERLSPDRRAQLDESLMTDPLAYAEALPGPWSEFRRAQITDLVERIYTGVKRRRPQVVVSAAVFPDLNTSFTQRYQDWGAWIRDGIIDVVAPMAYTADDERYQDLDGPGGAGRRRTARVGGCGDPRSQLPGHARHDRDRPRDGRARRHAVFLRLGGRLRRRRGRRTVPASRGPGRLRTLSVLSQKYGPECRRISGTGHSVRHS